jgi:solute carrier family 25 carnitine/acylcarnitine transporter 20/29
MLGSLTFYRRILHENLFRDHPLAVFTPSLSDSLPSADETPPKLPTLGHAMAGVLAGWTVSFIAAPVEHIKARLQVQYSSDKSKRLYKGPIDCTRKIVSIISSSLDLLADILQYQSYGVRGLYHGLTATLIFRTWFAVWWGTYDLWTNFLSKPAFNLNTPAINFWAGGLSAQLFWLSSYPSDVVKQRIMTDSLEKDRRKFWTWREAAAAVYKQDGYRGYWRGFLPCFLRAFPANGTALLAFEGVMRALG